MLDEGRVASLDGIRDRMLSVAERVWPELVEEGLGGQAGPEYERYFMSLRCVVLGPTGEVIEDPSGVFGAS